MPDTKHPEEYTAVNAAQDRAAELRAWATELRNFVKESRTETWRKGYYNKQHKRQIPDEAIVEAMTLEDGRRIIAEAKRLEELADLTTETLGS